MESFIMNSQKLFKVGVIGYGSSGRRYSKILKKMGYEVQVLRSGKVNKNIPDYDKDLDFFYDEEEFFSLNLHAVFICNPSHLHAQKVEECINKNLPFLVEKPVSDKIETIRHSLDRISKLDLVSSTGYMMQYDEGLIKAKKWYQDGLIGKPISIRIHWSTYLPDWHPRENYSESYAARKEMGGGVVLTCSHEINTLEFLFGKIKKINAYGVSDLSLKTDVEDSIDAVGKLENGASFSIHIDWLSKKIDVLLK